MPDGDFISRGFPAQWRAPLECFRGKHDPEVIADMCGRSLAAALRRTGGIPSLNEAHQILCAAAAREISPLDAFARIREFERHKHSHDVFLVAAMMRYLSPGVSPPSLEQLAQDTCREVVRANFTGPILPLGPDLDAYRSRSEIEGHLRACNESLTSDYASISKSLAKDPTAQSLRVVRERPSAADWLAEIVN